MTTTDGALRQPSEVRSGQFRSAFGAGSAGGVVAELSLDAGGVDEVSLDEGAVDEVDGVDGAAGGLSVAGAVAFGMLESAGLVD